MSIQLNITTLSGRIAMQIENLSKELDAEALKDVHGGIALTGQVVPTNIQSNELGQTFNVSSCAPVAIGNEGKQANYSSQKTISPVGSILVGPFDPFSAE
jgi:hypothetical protein